MNELMFASLHVAVETPAMFVRSLLYAQMPRIGFRSDFAHSISHFCPVEDSEFLLTSTITP